MDRAVHNVLASGITLFRVLPALRLQRVPAFPTVFFACFTFPRFLSLTFFYLLSGAPQVCISLQNAFRVLLANRKVSRYLVLSILVSLEILINQAIS